MQTAPDFLAGGDPSADPSAGGDFMPPQQQAAPEFDNATVGAADHGATMGGQDSQHPVSGQMLTEDDTAVSPAEQKYYDDFVTRALMFMNDPRKPLGKNGKENSDGKAPRDVIIDHLNVRGMSADAAVGRTTAQIAWLIFANAKHNGVDYPPDVLYHGADEIMSHVYEIGVQSGAIKNPPPPDSPEEQKLLGMAKMYACQFFGNNVIDSGLNDQQANRQYYLQQMQREADTGGLDNWEPNQNMSPEQLTNFMAKASQGNAALASMRTGAPSSISDFQKRGTPSLMPAGGGAQQQQPPPQEPPPQQGA